MKLNDINSKKDKVKKVTFWSYKKAWDIAAKMAKEDGISRSALMRRLILKERVRRMTKQYDELPDVDMSDVPKELLKDVQKNFKKAFQGKDKQIFIKD